MFSKLLVVFFSKSIGILPYKFLRFTSFFIGIIFYYIIPLRKKVVIENLKTAFPNLSDQEIKNLAFKNYISVAKTFIEIIKLETTSAEWILENVKIDNEEIITKHLDKKDSVIFLTAHFGNWEFGALTFGLKFNFSMNVLAKPQSNEYVTNFMSKVRTKFGNREIFTGSSVKDLYKALLNKESIGVVGDQRGSKEGPRVKFFNRDTAVYTGTATMALKTKSPIVTVFVSRQSDNTYIAHIDEISLENLPENQDEKVLEINQRYFNILEKTIQKYPEQWFWMHKIWKY